jgi:hypothetical protein
MGTETRGFPYPWVKLPSLLTVVAADVPQLQKMVLNLRTYYYGAATTYQRPTPCRRSCRRRRRTRAPPAARGAGRPGGRPPGAGS